ncbi:C6 zinc cluster transcription factor-like protein [Neonectria magnoliae]|uniref:C6 zinc cluster transcription factor-like protein n=1 Tax=Neonectria magnoliae TaxID=2732573 RepID=A0ABR1HQ06_9HYPO
MPLEVIYVTRHGPLLTRRLWYQFRTTWSVDHSTGIYSASIPSPTGIPADPALTSHGVKQAREMGSYLATLDPPIDAVYSSPYYRCLQTIAPFVEIKRQQLEKEPGDSDATTTTIRPEYGLCEFFGAAPFDHPIPASPEKLKAFFPAYDDTYMSALAPSRKGEGIDDLYRRVAGAVQAIINRCDAEGRRAVVLCTHAAVVIALGRVLTGRIPDSVDTDDFGAFTCGLSVYRRNHTGKSADQGRSHLGGISDSDKRGGIGASNVLTSEPGDMGKWDCELNSDCSFLSSGAERGWYVVIPIQQPWLLSLATKGRPSILTPVNIGIRKFSGDESFPGTGSMAQIEPDAKL